MIVRDSALKTARKPRPIVSATRSEHCVKGRIRDRLSMRLQWKWDWCYRRLKIAKQQEISYPESLVKNYPKCGSVWCYALHWQYQILGKSDLDGSDLCHHGATQRQIVNETTMKMSQMLEEIGTREIIRNIRFTSNILFQVAWQKRLQKLGSVWCNAWRSWSVSPFKSFT